MASDVRIIVGYDYEKGATLQQVETDLNQLNRRLQEHGTAWARSLDTAPAEGRVRQLASAINGTLSPAVHAVTQSFEHFGQTLSRIFLFTAVYSGISLIRRGLGELESGVLDLGKAFVDVNQKFANLDIVTGSIYKSTTAVKAFRSELMQITGVSPIPFEGLADFTQSLSIMPQIRRGLVNQVNQGTLGNPQGGFRQDISMAEQLLTYRPDKRIADVIFSLREALTGEFRSLVRRFEIPPSMIAAYGGKTLKELKSDPETTLEAIKNLMNDIITKQAVRETARQPEKLWQNLIEQLRDIPLLKIGDTGIYDRLLTTAQSIFDRVTKFVSEPLQGFGGETKRDAQGNVTTGINQYTDRIGAALNGVFSQLMGFASKSVEGLLTRFGYGKGAMPNVDVIERAVAAVTSGVESLTLNIPNFLTSVSHFFTNIEPIIRNIAKMAVQVGSFLGSSFTNHPYLTAAGVIAGPQLIGAGATAFLGAASVPFTNFGRPTEANFARAQALAPNYGALGIDPTRQQEIMRAAYGARGVSAEDAFTRLTTRTGRSAGWGLSANAPASLSELFGTRPGVATGSLNNVQVQAVMGQMGSLAALTPGLMESVRNFGASMLRFGLSVGAFALAGAAIVYAFNKYVEWETNREKGKATGGEPYFKAFAEKSQQVSDQFAAFSNVARAFLPNATSDTAFKSLSQVRSGVSPAMVNYLKNRVAPSSERPTETGEITYDPAIEAARQRAVETYVNKVYSNQTNHPSVELYTAMEERARLIAEDSQKLSDYVSRYKETGGGVDLKLSEGVVHNYEQATKYQQNISNELALISQNRDKISDFLKNSFGIDHSFAAQISEAQSQIIQQQLSRSASEGGLLSSPDEIFKSDRFKSTIQEIMGVGAAVSEVDTTPQAQQLRSYIETLGDKASGGTGFAETAKQIQLARKISQESLNKINQVEQWSQGQLSAAAFAVVQEQKANLAELQKFSPEQQGMTITTNAGVMSVREATHLAQEAIAAFTADATGHIAALSKIIEQERAKAIGSQYASQENEILNKYREFESIVNSGKDTYLTDAIKERIQKLASVDETISKEVIAKLENLYRRIGESNDPMKKTNFEAEAASLMEWRSGATVKVFEKVKEDAEQGMHLYFDQQAPEYAALGKKIQEVFASIMEKFTGALDKIRLFGEQAIEEFQPTLTPSPLTLNTTRVNPTSSILTASKPKLLSETGGADFTDFGDAFAPEISPVVKVYSATIKQAAETVKVVKGVNQQFAATAADKGSIPDMKNSLVNFDIAVKQIEGVLGVVDNLKGGMVSGIYQGQLKEGMSGLGINENDVKNIGDLFLEIKEGEAGYDNWVKKLTAVSQISSMLAARIRKEAESIQDSGQRKAMLERANTLDLKSAEAYDKVWDEQKWNQPLSFFQRLGDNFHQARGKMFDFRNAADAVSQSLSQNLGGAFYNIVMGTQKAGDAFRQFAASMIADLAKMAAEAAAKQLLGLVITAFGGAVGGSGIGGALSGMFSGVATHAEGGRVRGGSGQRDDVPALLTGGEYVIRREAVDRYGAGLFEALNSGHIRHYAGGGLVSSGVAMNKALSSSHHEQNNVTVNINGDGSGNSKAEKKREGQIIDSERAEAMGRKIHEAVLQVIAEQRRQGGQLRG